VIRGGGGIVHETVNWQAFLAFNNSFAFPASTGAIIDEPNNTTLGGTITTGNLSPTPPFPWTMVPSSRSHQDELAVIP